MMRRLLVPFSLLISIITLNRPARAQQVRPGSSADIYHELSQLQHLVNVLYVGAHPDDENTRLLAWLANEQNVRTAYLSLTRGDGGQNLIGSEQGAVLGLIRTHELMEARKIDGAEQFFTRAIDFGFSKNSKETFKHWDEDLLTHDVVWVMRKFRPDVVICRFPPTAAAGHGQHAASSILAANAFDVVGKKDKYADELKYYPTWQPKRLLINTFRFGSVNTTSEDQFKLQVGQYSPLLGMGYGELAGISRSVHKSQGAGTPSVPGLQTEYFQLVKGEPLSKSLFDGIDITWNRVGRKDIGEQIEQIRSRFSFQNPDASLPALLKLRKSISTVKDDYWRLQKLKDLDQIILHCSGLMAEVFAAKPEAVAGDRLPFTLHLIARSSTPIEVTAVNWINETGSVNQKLVKDDLVTINHEITIPANTPISQPYWLEQPPKNPGQYSLPADSLLGLPETPNHLQIQLTVNIGGERFQLPVPLSYKKLDPIKGDLVEPLRIVPAADVEFTQSLIVTQPDRSLNTNVRLRAAEDIRNGKLVITNSKPILNVENIQLDSGSDTIIPVRVSASQSAQLSKEEYFLNPVLSADNKTFNKAQHLIQYSHIPTLQYFTNPASKVVVNNWKCTAQRIGYIEGAGDFTAAFLRLAGLTVDVLQPSDFTSAARLARYDAIIAGVRAANVQKQMPSWMPALLGYVRNGGTLIMQYNTPQELSTTRLGPYPFTFTSARVTEEDAPVKFLIPDHRLLNYPNKITQEDFADWVQERGLYFPTTWDDHYQPLFEMNDTGEAPLTGSTLYTRYGKGNYIYTGLSFFRQLPVGYTGAIRLLMNMLSAGK